MVITDFLVCQRLKRLRSLAKWDGPEISTCDHIYGPTQRNLKNLWQLELFIEQN